jgi:hypothetical protein
MLNKLIPIVGLLLCSCGIASQLTSGDKVGELSVGEHLVSIDSSGSGHFASATIDAELQPRLAAAFAAGEAPSYPLIGRDHAQWIRSLDIVASSDDGWYSLTAKALAPYPIKLSVSKRNAQGEYLIAETDSEVFNRATHFASVLEKVELRNGDVLIVSAPRSSDEFDSLPKEIRRKENDAVIEQRENQQRIESAERPAHWPRS